MYPTLVAVLVNSHHTFDQMYLMDSSLLRISPSASNIHQSITEPLVFVLSADASNIGTLPEELEVGTKNGL